MFNQITFYPLFGFPLILYGGLVTLASMLVTASIMVLNDRGMAKIPFEWHHRMAIITIALALIHGSMGILSYL